MSSHPVAHSSKKDVRSNDLSSSPSVFKTGWKAKFSKNRASRSPLSLFKQTAPSPLLSQYAAFPDVFSAKSHINIPNREKDYSSSYGSSSVAGASDTSSSASSDLFKTPMNQIYTFDVPNDTSYPPISISRYGTPNSSTSSSSPYVLSSPAFVTPPKIRPFAYTLSNSRKNKSLIGSRCCVCNELLENKLQEERLVELVCGDSCHEECFRVTIDYEIEVFFGSHNNTKSRIKNKLDIIQLIFPSCPVCSQKFVPLDDFITDKFVSKALLSQQSVPDTVFTALSKTLKNPISSRVSSSSSSSSESSMKGTSIERGRSILASPRQKFHQKKASRGSSISAVSSITTSASRSRSSSPAATLSTINTTSIKIHSHAGITLDDLRAKFMTYLSASSKNKIPLHVMNGFGILRLVDQIKVSYSAHHYEKKNCYLFMNYLVIFSPSYDTIKIFSLANLRVHTSTPSIIGLSNGSESVYLKGEPSSITEKWVVGFSDFNFRFPSDIFTSTITLPELKNDMEALDRNSDSFSIISSTSTISQVPTNVSKRNSIMSRRTVTSSLRESSLKGNLTNHQYSKLSSIILIIHSSREMDPDTTFKSILRALLFKYKVYLILANADSSSFNFQQPLNLSDHVFEKGDDLASFNIKDFSEQATLSLNSKCREFIDDSNENINEINTVIISDTTISIRNIFPTKSLLLEVGTARKNSDQSISHCQKWDNVMELIYNSNLNVDFDNESDSDYSSEDEDSLSSFSSSVDEKVKHNKSEPNNNTINLGILSIDTPDTDSDLYSSDDDSDQELISKLVERNRYISGDYSGSTSATTITPPENYKIAIADTKINNILVSCESETQELQIVKEKRKILEAPIKSGSTNSNRTCPPYSDGWNTLISDIEKALIDTTNPDC